MLIFIIAAYLIFAFILTLLGIDRQSEWIKIFFISVLLTPVLGLVYLYTKRNKVSHVKYYHCHNCDYIYPIKMRDCPICMEEGVKVKLKKYKSPYSISSNIGDLNLVH
ncbi:MAG: hypothetical protein CMF58_04635 [Lentimicrobiaceae bacterium]|jgi:hypothetical protein|nr:hypothetical protein [Lentimicrobiaceae bacterium]|tara:strand:+ start:24938 stop:25261 length:324 start_codon:yes stop_codon:yes gene_type:complete